MTMLTHIHISNLVTIHVLDLEFKNHTTVITGETGAGKSILIEAIELALGGRATSDMVRIGQEKAEIHISFDLTHLAHARAWLQNFDLDQDAECIIRRTIHRDGRSRSYINGQPITLQPLREFSELLLQIHGQHEHQALLKSDFQRDLLDRFASHQLLVDTVYTLAFEWQLLHKEILNLRHLTEERNSRGEWLKFQLHELEELSLMQDEFQSLDLEHKQLAHAGDLLQSINHALNVLTDNENTNAMHALNQAMQALEIVQNVNPKIPLWIESLKNAIIQVSDTEDELRRYLDGVDLDPERLQWLETRISLIFDLARKHKVSPNELFDLQQKITTEYHDLNTSDARLAELTSKLDMLESRYYDNAKKLSESRLQAANPLAKEITKIMQELSLPKAEFHILFEQDKEPHITSYGLEKIIFQIKTNVGHTLQPLAKIASGGELSRVSLAIHMATALQHTTPTLIFDEVDVGVGGGTAEMVGKLLRRLGETHQVICITHQPQVAALGHHHVFVRKIEKNNTTQSQIKLLSDDEKIQEIARMLGGVEMTQKTIEHAKEMLEKIV
jgi:DNA repair protein RecN (Recombination protein N)